MTTSIFAPYARKAWPHVYEGQLIVSNIHGGVPRDPKTTEGWLATKVKDKDAITQEAIAEIMAARGVDADAAVAELAKDKVNGFYRDEQGLHIPGNNLKACLKEAASVCANESKIPLTGWGNVPEKEKTARKWIKGWFPEHVFVAEDRLYLGVSECDEIEQRFTRSKFGSSITREEVVREAKISFTIETDHKFTDEQWGIIWLTAEQQGLGASRSQGFGRFAVTRWDSVA